MEVIEPRATDAPIPLSFAQERLWFLHRLGIVGAAYNIPLIVRIRGEVNVDALNGAFLELIHRHESLRTRFDLVDGVPRQIIMAPLSDFHSDLILMPGMKEPSQDDLMHRLTALTQRTVNLTTGPLIHVSLLRLGPQHHILHVVMHHAITDGWSRGIFFKELSGIYNARIAGTAMALPPPSLQFGDYAIWERKQLSGDALQKHLVHWRDRLANAPAMMALPTDKHRARVGGFGGGMISFEVPSHLCSALRQLGQQQGVTLYMLLLATFQVLLSRWSGQGDIVIGSPVANRPTRELENVIGYFVNVVVLRGILSADPLFTQLLQQVRDDTLDAQAHSNVPLEKLAEQLPLLRDFSHQPIFQVTLALQNTQEESIALAGLQTEELKIEVDTARFDLELYFYDRPDGLIGQFTYASALFERSTIERMAGHFITLLAEVAVDPHRQVSLLPMLAREERNLLRSWSEGAHQDLLQTLLKDNAPLWGPDASPDAVEAYVLNAHMDFAGVGIVGELYVGGSGSTRADGPSLTDEQFVAHPWHAGRRLYRTGRLARYLSDGALEVRGYVDQRVDVRGYRIELGEVEAALRANPAVDQVAVVVRDDAFGSKQMLAYVVTRSGQSSGTLLGDLKARVPAYMVPDACIALDSLPMDVTGRVDQGALPVPVASTIAMVPEPPQSSLEEMLASLWSEILEIDSVSRNDNFFARGGNSLRALLMIARVQVATGIEVSISALFDGPTIRELAQSIETTLRVREDAALNSSEVLAPGETHGVI
jgi:hypothetical protein